MRGAVAVYVDDYRIPWRGAEWSHLTADSDAELHAFAERLGLAQRRFHHKPERPWRNHYDVREAERRQAVRLGAKPVSSRETVKRTRAKRLALERGPRRWWGA